MRTRGDRRRRHVMLSCAVMLGTALSGIGSRTHTAQAEPGEGSNSASLTPLRSIARSDRRDAQRQRAAQLSWSRDPFMRSTTTNQVNGLSLSGILWDAATPMAIINGQTLRVGEACDGYRVTEITPEHVAVTDETQTFQLHIAP